MLVKKFKLYESPDGMRLPNGELIDYFSDDARHFGYFKNKLITGKGYHKMDRDYFDFAGRVWLRSKIISFWKYPENKEQLKRIVDDLSQRFKTQIWNNGWLIEIVKDNDWFAISSLYPELIPLEDFSFSKERSPEELKSQHTLSPLLKQKVKGFPRKKLSGQLPGEMEVAARARMYQEKNRNIMFTKFANFINENVLQEQTKDWFLKQINEPGFIKTRNTREKFMDYINRVFTFSEDDKNIDKKELTQIKNAFDKLISTYYNFGFTDSREERRKEIESLAIKKGEQRYDIKDPVLKLLYWGNFYSLNDANRIVKQSKILEFDKEEKAFYDKWFVNVDKWAELFERLEEIRKILNPTAEERKAKELLQIKGKLNPKIKDAIDEIAEDFRKVIEESELRSYKHVIKIYRDKYGDTFNRDQVRRDDKRWGTPGIIDKVYKRDPNDKSIYSDIMKLIPNYEEIIEAESKRVSFETIELFKFKMYNKIGGMISEIDKDFDIKVSSNNWQYNEITFFFKDDSRFTIKNQIVAKTSHLGTNFYTYPTTFHDAYLPNGEKIPWPDEYTVKKAFNDYYGKPSDNEFRQS